ncbi:MAG TPA: WD40 repeat domain-containing protein [Pyrinomonadaceae bacterium]|nr:WD40 repeat domain-containing protein [Pyrinomonadaceae bacterium]
MKSQKSKHRSWAGSLASGAFLLTALGFVVVMAATVAGQTSAGSENTTRFDDVVFAVAFSPDGQTLAIARGAAEPVRQFARIELWDSQTGQLRHIIKGFDGPIQSISFSPDGGTLISSSTEFRTARLQQKARSREGETFAELKWWDSRTGELKKKQVLPDEDMSAIRATQSPDGKLLALSRPGGQGVPYVTIRRVEGIGSGRAGIFYPRPDFWSFYTTRVQLVDAHTGELKHKLDRVHPAAISFSPDGNLLAVATRTEVKLWNAQTGREVRKLKKLRGNPNALAFSPNGQTLAVASTRFEREHDKDVIRIIGLSEVKLFEVATGKVILDLKDIGAVNSLVYSADGRILVMGGILPRSRGEAAGLKLVDLQTSKALDLQTGADYTEIVDSLALSQEGNLLAFRAGPATVKLVDTLNGKLKQTFDADSVGDAVERPANRFLVSVKRMLAVAFSTDGKTVAAESEQGEIKLWDYRTGELKQELSVEQDDPLLVAASADGKVFAEVNRDQLLFSDLSSDTKRPIPRTAGPTPTALAISADGRLLAVGSATDVTLLLPSGEVTRKLSGYEGVLSRLTFSRDGRLLAGVTNNEILIWAVANGQVEKRLPTRNEVTAIAFSPEGQKLATGASDRMISIWNLQTGLAQSSFRKHESSINALAFSHDGQLLASGGDDRTIVLWEVAAGKSKRTFKGHDQTVTSLAFSADGQLLASGSGNASVVIWEVATGKLSRVLR